MPVSMGKPLRSHAYRANHSRHDPCRLCDLFFHLHQDRCNANALGAHTTPIRAPGILFAVVGFCTHVAYHGLPHPMVEPTPVGHLEHLTPRSIFSTFSPSSPADCCETILPRHIPPCRCVDESSMPFSSLPPSSIPIRPYQG